MAAGEEESGPSGGEVEPQPKQKRPQRKAATSRKIVVDQSGDEVESDNSEEQEGDAELKPTKSRQKVAENSSGAKAKTTQKSKKIVSSNVSFTTVHQTTDFLQDPRQMALAIRKSGRLDPYLQNDPC